MNKYRIAYIDENDGWIQTFYQTFKQDFDVLKVRINIESSLEAIVNELLESNIDAIITDYLLEEEGDVSFNGNLIVDAIRKIKPYLPILMLTAYEPQAISQMDDVHIIYDKNILDVGSEEELSLFKMKLMTTIANYYARIKCTQNRVEELVKKRNETELTMAEESELTKLFILMNEYEPEGNCLPVNLILPESITKLNEFVTETKEIINELKKIKRDE